ncbi:MAG: hypothetical protein ABEJ31_00405 [Haloarculaceae archaeon]
MAASPWEDLSAPFLVLGLLLSAVVAVGYLPYPHLYGHEARLALAYGGLLVLFALSYGYRPLRESRYGSVLTALFVVLFALVNYAQGARNPLMPFGLLVVGLTALCYQLYKLGSDGMRRWQMS